MLLSRTLRARAQRPSRPLFAAGALVLLAGGCISPPDHEGQEAASATNASAPGTKREATIPADGWNGEIAWRGLEEGLTEARSAKMPMMMVVHTAWCGNCQKLKGTFNEDDELERLSERFVMVHVDQDTNPGITLYGPDGQYIPRVMFLDPEGNIDQRLQNPNRPNRFRYFYTPNEDLTATMRLALDQHDNKS